MDEIMQSDIASIFMSVFSSENPQSLVSPEGFRDKVLTVIENELMKIHLNSVQSHHLSNGCVHVNTCSDCLLLSTLSTVETLFEFAEERNACTVNKRGKANCADNLPRDSMKTTLRNCSQHDRQFESLAVIENWYHNAAKLLCSSSITSLLVKCLMCSSKFTSFLARKALITGMRTQYIEVSQVLNLLKQEWSAGFYSCLPLIEILRDMMSQRRFLDKQINCKTFSQLKEVQLQSFIGAKFNENEKSFFDTGGLLEYLSLLRKVIKYGIRCEENKIQIISFMSEIVNKILLPYGDHIFNIAKADKGHLICLEYIKAFNTFLDIRFLEEKSTLQECTFQVSASLLTKMHKYLLLTESKNLLCSVNFIGTALSSESKRISNPVSALKRQVILLALKSGAITLKGENSHWTSTGGDLECFWKEILCLISHSRGQLTEDWLPVVFADQDDQWITALFCLLIIHKELKKWQSKMQFLFVNEKTTESHEFTLKDLQQTISPHRLFLQLAEFIDYDHLVFTDFLTSPETPFLSYFTKYLHVMREDWQGFVSACLRNDEVVEAKQHSVLNSGNCTAKKYLGTELGSCKSSVQDLFPSDFSTAETSLQTDQDFIRISQRVPNSNNLLPSQSTKETFPLCSVQNSHSLKAVTNSHLHLLEQQNDPFQNPVVACSDPFYSSSVLSCDIAQNSSTLQLLKNQEHSISPTQRDDTFSSLCGDSNGRKSFALVMYSDSDSEDCAKEARVNLTVKKQSLKRPLSSESESDTYEEESLIEAHENTFTVQGSGSEEESTASEHESSSDHMMDQYKKCSSELDSVMGMLIRLRLHIQRLDHSRLFPYSVKPLLLLLEECEELYEKPS